MSSDYQLSSVAQSCRILCDPTNRSTPGLPVYSCLIFETQGRNNVLQNTSTAGPETKVGSGKTVEQGQSPARVAGGPLPGLDAWPWPQSLARLSPRPAWTSLPLQPCPHTRQPLDPVDFTSQTWGLVSESVLASAPPITQACFQSLLSQVLHYGELMPLGQGNPCGLFPIPHI